MGAAGRRMRRPSSGSFTRCRSPRRRRADVRLRRRRRRRQRRRHQQGGPRLRAVVVRKRGRRQRRDRRSTSTSSWARSPRRTSTASPSRNCTRWRSRTWTATACRTSSPASGSGRMRSTIRARSNRPCCIGSKRCATAARCGSCRIDRRQLGRRHAGRGRRSQRRRAGRISSSATRRARSFSFTSEGRRSSERGKRRSRCRRKQRSPTPAAAKPPSEPEDGFPATAADGRVLNLDFEKGDLSRLDGRRATRSSGQPIEGDTVHPRRGDSVSGHRGQVLDRHVRARGDGPQGTLTSVPFPVTHPYASFLVGGGAGGALRVEIVRADTDEVVFQASGRSAGGDAAGRGRSAAAAWARRFICGSSITAAPVGGTSTSIIFAFTTSSRRSTNAAADGPATPTIIPTPACRPRKRPAVMKLPRRLFGDGRCRRAGREAADRDGARRSRPRCGWPRRTSIRCARRKGKGRDRILIFEDADGDGRFDKRKVFAEGLNLVSGLEVGFGGVWVGAAPYLHVHSRSQRRRRARRRAGNPARWLGLRRTRTKRSTRSSGARTAGSTVATACSRIRASASRARRTASGCRSTRPSGGIIPTRHVFEVFAEGTSNPWGVDFDDHGQAFCTACVIPHLYHIIQGARYQRQAGEHFNPYTYADIQTIADHRHYVGDKPHARQRPLGRRRRRACAFAAR